MCRCDERRHAFVVRGPAGRYILCPWREGLLIQSWCGDETVTNPKRERGILRFLPRSRFGLVWNQHVPGPRRGVDLLVSLAAGR